MPAIEGRILIRLFLAGNCVQGIELTSSRPVRASSVLEGRTVDEALRLLRLLFSICGTAQGCAGLAACEMALGISPEPEQIRARELLRLAETAYEHLSRVLLDWPALLGAEPDPRALAALRGGRDGFRRALYGDAEWCVPGGAPLAHDAEAVVKRIEALERVLADHVLGLPLPQWLTLSSLESLQAWAETRSTIAGRALSKVIGSGLAGLGRSPIESLPEIPLGHLDRELADDIYGDFLSHPSWNGQVFETGPLARQRVRPLIESITAQFGNGLLTRLAARLLELASIPGEMRAYLSLQEPPVQGYGSAGTGLGMVEAARGRLVHRVELQAGRIARYQILAPTEWNFHPGGAVAQGLVGIAGEDQADLRRKVAWLVDAVDPCVAYDLAPMNSPWTPR
jgi:hypothetical protein